MKLLTDKQIELIKQDAVAQYKRLQNENILKKENDDRQATMVGFNLSDPNINVFCIERICHGKADERTVIGYYLSKEFQITEERIVQTWYLYISRQQHNALVEKWATYLGEKTKPKKSLLKG